MMYVRFPLSLRNVEDLLHERKRRTRRLILMGSYLRSSKDIFAAIWTVP